MAPSTCRECGTSLGPAQRDCPSCHALVHAEALTALAALADGQAKSGQAGDAIATWRRMLDLLPPESRQYAALAARTVEAEATLPRAQVTRDANGKALGRLGATGAFALAAGKLKAFVPMVATIALSIGAYWTIYGLWFAVGFVASIFVHEMGHVIALRHHRIATSLPMFVPGFGAFVRLRQATPAPRIDWQIGLAGPIAGALAAAACLAVYAATGDGFWRGLAQVGALINLFNLTPVWTLDGSRAFRAMAIAQRALCAVALGGAVLATGGNTMLWLPLLAAIARVFTKPEPGQRDLQATATYVLLVAALAAIAAVTIGSPR